MADAVITVQGLRKRYGQHEAVKGIDFRVDQGEVFGFLGTNGAGKTTTIEILEGYRSRTAGAVSVLGVDPARPTTAWRERIGLVLQESELDPLHTVRETVAMFACYYRDPRPVDDTIALVGLAEKRDARVGSLPISIDAYFTAGIAAYSIMLIGFSSLLISIVTAREDGLLKRYRGTPMPSGVFLAAEILQTMVTIAVMVTVLLAIGAIAYDVELDATAVFAFAVYVVVGTATMCALGLALSRVATSVDVASTIGPFIAVILAFVSGVFVPVTELPQWLVDVGRVFPLAHLAEGLQRALTPAAEGSRIDASNLAVLALWGVVGMVVAIRRFRWEPLAAGT